jgi:hypothetical protein
MGGELLLLDDHVYDLMMQMIAENKSLWRIKNNYKEDADCEKCRDFWNRLEKDKEDHIEELTALLKGHMA